MLPKHYKLDIEFVDEKGKRSGKIKEGKEPKLAYYLDENGKTKFYFEHAYREMEAEFKSVHPELFYEKTRGKKHIQTKIPYDWTLYYLRKKGLTKELTKEELAWVTMSFLQKRGYEKVMGLDEKEQESEELSEIINAKVVSVELFDAKSADGLNKYHIVLADEYGNVIFEYDEEASFQITQKDELKQIERISKFDKNNDELIKSVDVVISEIKNLEIVDVINTHEKKKDKTAFEIILSSGWKYEYLSQYAPKFKGDNRDFIISTCFNQKGCYKKRSIKMPSEDDWQLEKLKTETSIENYNLSHNTCGVASYIYDTLLQNPAQKIKAGLVTTIERDYYRKELKKILEVQKKYHEELKDVQKYKDALCLLYPNNETHRNTLGKQDFSTLLSDDIIFYQRDLKTKKSLIKNCPYEEHVYWDKDTGERKSSPVKCIAKSNPLYQEFRLWQFIKRLRIIKLEDENERKEKLVNQDVTDTILTIPVKEELFGYLNNKKEITQDVLLKKLFHKDKYKEYKWNFEEDYKEPCNETRYNFVLRLKRIKNFDWEKFLNARAKTHEPKGKMHKSDVIVDGCTNEYLLWHFFYSVKKNEQRTTGLPHLIEKLLINANIDLSFKDKVVEMLSSISTYKNEYGTYSEKAIKKLLPFLRLGKYWCQEDVEIIKACNTIKPEVLEKENIQDRISDLQGLWVSSACYIVYGRYSEVGEVKRWMQPNDILNYLRNDFRNNSLNNPVVERVVREMLLIVHDIWTTFGDIENYVINEAGEKIKTYKKFFDQINIEIGTSLKKSNKEKDADSRRNKENRLANERAIAMLKELKSVYSNSDIKVKSPFQQEKMRILEAGIVDAIKYDKDEKIYNYKVDTIEERFTKKEIKDLLKKEVSKISPKDMERYRLWLEQRYLSPYTGKPISLSNLFDRTKYEIEHVFPQERVTLNSYKNKVICETIVNKAKGAMTGYEFILNHKDGKCIYQGHEIELLKPDKYVEHVQTYITDKEKQEILLSKDIPSKFGNNQLNNSRYIAKLAMSLLSNLVREDGEKEFKSKNVLVVSGGVTSILKQDWQLDETWNELIKPRFIRMNKLLKTNEFWEERSIEGHSVFVPTVPNSEINKKRIDHRHHALDALIVALTTSCQVNYINNISSLDVNSERKKERWDLKVKYMGSKKSGDNSKERFFLPPMQYKQDDDLVTYSYAFKDSEPQEIFKYVVLEALQNTLVTFKQKNRILRQRNNWIQHPNYNKEGMKEADTNLKKNYSVRQSLHKATYYGMREIRPMSIREAIDKSNDIVENRIKLLIQKFTQEGKTKESIVTELEKTDPIVYVREKCATTQWSHTLDYFAGIKEKEDGKDKKKEKSGKNLITREIESIADITIQNILKKHLSKYDSVRMSVAEAVEFYDYIVNEEQKSIVDKYIKDGNDLSNNKIEIDVFVGNNTFESKQIIQNPQIAFSADGIKALNTNIKELNNGKNHKPIYKVQMVQAYGKMFPVSEPEPNKPVIVKNKQYVISDSGSNNYCGIYKSSEGKTKIYVPSLRTTIDSYRNNEEIFPDRHPDDLSYYYRFTLSPLDLVYMPTEDEIECHHIGYAFDYSRVFVVNDFNDSGIVYFRPYCFANAITEKEVDYRIDERGKLIGSFSDKTANFEGKSIRDNCVPIKVDRLGNIIELNGKKL